MHGIRPKVGRQGGAEIGWLGRLLEFYEKTSIANGKKHVALDITKKTMSIILAPTDLCHPLFGIRLREGAVGCCSLSLSKVCGIKDNLVDPVSQIHRLILIIFIFFKPPMEMARTLVGRGASRLLHRLYLLYFP